jgi:hypothetical protein
MIKRSGLIRATGTGWTARTECRTGGSGGRLKAQANDVASETVTIEPVKPAGDKNGLSTVGDQDDDSRRGEHLAGIAPSLKRMDHQN